MHLSILIIRKFNFELKGYINQKKCPHCESLQPRLKKDGYTKIFKITLTHKEKQVNNLHGTNTDVIDFSDIDSESSNSENESEKNKKKKEEKKEEDKEIKEQRKQLLVHPLEVKEHINKFWHCEKELLSLLYV